MISEIIEKYKSGYNLEKLASEYKMGKLKVKTILLNNNVPIKTKGGQLKNKQAEIDFSKWDDKNATCNCCGKEFSDVHNKSGALISHIKTCYPNVDIPSKFKRVKYLGNNGEYWHMQYFTLVEKLKIEYFKCPECDWETKDLTNKTGAITKHIENIHSTVSEFVSKYPNLSDLFSAQVSSIKKNEMFDNDERLYVVCKVCQKRFETITETHLSKHDMNLAQYKILYPKTPIVSENLKDIFKENIQNSEYNILYRSKGEIELFDFVKSLDDSAIHSDKKILNGAELDIYCENSKIAFEYNGLFWHSEKQGKTKNYHLDKTKMCEKKGIRLIHIFSDEWETKQEIIKKRIKHLFGKSETRIYARNCEVKEINKKTKSKFLNEYHLQGNDKSKVAYGLYYKNNLVSVATFGKLRLNMGHKTSESDVWELYRFCGENVIGGFSKLLKRFIGEQKPQKIITYSDRNWTPFQDDSFYGKVGFSFVSYTKPNYYYMFKYKKRENRFNFRKSILVKQGYDANKSEMQIMLENGYDIIWDTGNLKYEMTIS